jgi:hypothetical protein
MTGKRFRNGLRWGWQLGELAGSGLLIHLSLIRQRSIRLAKPAGCVRPHPVVSSRGRVSPRRCSSSASRASERNSSGLSRSLRTHVSSSSKDSRICAAIRVLLLFRKSLNGLLEKALERGHTPNVAQFRATLPAIFTWLRARRKPASFVPVVSAPRFLLRYFKFLSERSKPV